jgi:hypothetical protein
MGTSTAASHTINGDEISIETVVGEDPGYDHDFWTRRLALGAVQSQLEHDLTLPFTLHLTFEEQSAEVLVDGNPVTFRGIGGGGLDCRRKDLNIAGLVLDS